MLKAAIFDMDGLLVDSEIWWDEMNTAFLAKRGLAYTPEVQRTMLGKREIDIVRYCKNYLGLAGTEEEICAERLAVVKKLFREKLEIKRGARELLEYFKNQNVPRALATGSVRDLADIALGKLNLYPYFGAIVTGDIVKKGKPHPESFLLAAEKLQVAPEHCVVFEDAPAGIEAAHRAGMKAVAVPHASSPREILGEADVIIERLDQFRFELLR